MSRPYQTLPPSAEVSPEIVLATVAFGIVLIYSLISAPAGLPAIWELLLITLPGKLFGPAVRERLELMFGVGLGPGNTLRRVRNTAGSVLGVNGNGAGGSYVCGLWNSGNTCYQNSVLQSMASLTYLKPHLDMLMAKYETEEEDGKNYYSPSSILNELLDQLNTVTDTPRAISAPSIVRVGGRWNEQQDAQEFFQKLTGVVEKEALRRVKELREPKGLELLPELVGSGNDREKKKVESRDLVPKDLENPFEGLLAQRVGCLQCGYVEAIRMQNFTSLSLPMSSTVACSLEQCLSEFTSIERIENVECEKCSLLTKKEQLTKFLDKASTPPAESISPQLLQTAKERLECCNEALDSDDFSKSTFETLKIASKTQTNKTKHIMIAKPPKVLVLHLNRSQFNMFTGMSAKNYAALSYPKLLNMAGWTTRHDCLEVNPGLPISDVPESDARTILNAEGKLDLYTINLYELKSVVAHYGGHHNGHYVAYRKSEKTWFKISDDEVYTCTEEDALRASNAFMLFYEKFEESEVKEFIQQQIQRSKEISTCPFPDDDEDEESIASSETKSEGTVSDTTSRGSTPDEPKVKLSSIRTKLPAEKNTLPSPPPSESDTEVSQKVMPDLEKRHEEKVLRRHEEKKALLDTPPQTPSSQLSVMADDSDEDPGLT